jgi:hypothetical protein
MIFMCWRVCIVWSWHVVFWRTQYVCYILCTYGFGMLVHRSRSWRGHPHTFSTVNFRLVWEGCASCVMSFRVVVGSGLWSAGITCHCLESFLKFWNPVCCMNWVHGICAVSLEVVLKDVPLKNAQLYFHTLPHPSRLAVWTSPHCPVQCVPVFMGSKAGGMWH